MAPSETERDLNRLEAELKRLEAEYNMFFAGRLPRPPWETRSRVDALVKRYDKAGIQNTGERFRFEAIQTRYMKFVELWDRGLRAREEGRSGPFSHPSADQAGEAPHRAADRILRVASFRNPAREGDKLQELYDALAEAGREVGQEPLPYGRFTELVEKQVQRLGADGGAEIAFRVAVKDGRVSFTARRLKSDSETE